LFNPNHIVGSPFVLNVVPGATDYPYTTAYGPGVNGSTAGNVATFVIQSKDQIGNNKTVAGDVYDVQLVGTVGTTAKLSPFKPPEYLGQGQYLVSYKATISGTYQISIQVGGTDIYCGLGVSNKCSPFTVVVTSGKTVAYTSKAIGFAAPQMDSLAEMIAGQASNFTIQAMDTYSNKREVGGDIFDTRVVLVADSTVHYRGSVLEYQSNGLYNVQLSVPKAGVYTMLSYYQNSPILMCPGQVCSPIGTPSTLTVVHNVLHPPSSYATDTGTQGLSQATSNIPNSFTIYAVDSFSNLRTGATTPHSVSTGDGMSDAFLVTITSPLDAIVTSSAVQVLTASSSSQVGSFKLTYGSFTTTLCATCGLSLAGNVLSVNVNLVGLLSVGTKFTVNACVLNPTVITPSSITVNANHACAAFSGAANSLNVASTTPRLTALLPQNINAVAMKYALELLDPGNRVNVARTTNGAGNFVWKITFLSRLKSWSTAKLAVEYPPNTASLYNAPLVVSTVASGGVYPVSYTMTVAGVYTMNVTSQGLHILGSPFTLTVRDAAVDGTSSVAAGGNWYSRPLPIDYRQINILETLPGKAGQPFTFNLQAKDARRYDVQVLRSRATIVANVQNVQQVLPLGSSFTLSFRGSAPITVSTGTTYTALASTLQNLPTIGTGGVTISAATGTTVTNNQPFLVTFTQLAGPLPSLVPNANAAVTQVTPGVTSFRQEIQTFTCVAATPATAGSFNVYFGTPSNTANVLATSTVSAFAAQIQTLVGSSVTVTPETATTALCAATGVRLFIQFNVAQGNLPALTYSLAPGATMTLSSEKDTGGALGGIAPLWGSFTLSYAGETTLPALPFDASAAVVASALNSLQSFDGVVVTKDVLDVSTEGGNSDPQITAVWSITFTQNVGNLTLLSVDNSGLAFSNSGQQAPAMDITKYISGINGNNRSDVLDLPSVSVTVQQNYVNPGLQEIQTLTCTGSSSFTLTFGGNTITVAPSLSLAAFKSLLSPLVTGGILVTSTYATTVCHPYIPYPVVITFFVPLPVNLLAWGSSLNEITIVRTQTGVASTSTLLSIANFEQQTLVCTGTGSATFDITYGTASINVNAGTTASQLASQLNGMAPIQALGGVSVSISNGQSAICAASTPANVVITFNSVGNPSTLQAQNLRAGITSVTITERVRGLDSLSALTQGQYAIQFTPTIAGLYTFGVSVGGSAAMNPPRILVAPSRSSGPFCTHNANSVATQGILENFVVQSRDMFLNPLDGSVELGSAGYQATLVLKNQSMGPVTVTEATPNTDGTYKFSYMPRVYGNHSLKIEHRLSGGLLATYFANPDFSLPEIYCVTQRLSASPLCDGTRVEGPINFTWGQSQPPNLLNPSFPTTRYSVIWRGDLAVPKEDDYTIIVTADGSVDLYLDDMVLIQHNGNTSSTTSATTHITPGTFHSLIIRYSVGASPGIALSWSTPSQAAAVIPSSQLFFRRQIDRSPFSVHVYPGAMVAATSSSSYVSNTTTTSLSPVSFIITTRDNESNVRLNFGRDPLDVTVVGSDGWAAIGRVNEVTQGSPISITPSLLCAACVQSLAGNVITVNADVLDQLIPSMRFRVIWANAGTLTPTQLTDCYFTVVSTTAFDTVAGTSTVTVASPHGCSPFTTQSFALSLVVPLNWRYLGTASVSRGSLSLTATSSDFRYLPSDNPLVRGDTIVVGQEIHQVDPVVGTFNNLQIPLAEPYTGPDAQNVRVYKAGTSTGSYLVNFVPEVKGTYTLDVSTPKVKEVQTLTTSASTALGGTFVLSFTGLANGQMKLSTTPSIAYNADALTMKNALEGQPSIPTGSISVAPVVCQNGDATLGCTWTITFDRSPDEGQLNLLNPIYTGTLTGNSAAVAVTRLRSGAARQHLNGFPTTLIVRPSSTNAAVTTALGQGLVYAVAGNQSTFSIQAKDTHGNNKEDSDPLDYFDVTLVPAATAYQDSAIVKGSVVYAGNGLYNVSYTPLKSGPNTLVVAMAVLPEIQTLTLDFSSSTQQAGTFTLSFGPNMTTIPLAWDSTAAQVRTALLAFHANPVTVTRSIFNNGFIHTITFTTDVGNVPLLVVNNDLIFSTVCSMAPVQDGTKTHIKTSSNLGQAMINEVQVIRVESGGGAALNTGGFRLSWNGLSTSVLAYNADAPTVQAALQGLLMVGSVLVTVSTTSSTFSQEWIVTFSGSLAGTAQTMYWSSARYLQSQYIQSTRMIGNLAALTATAVSLGPGVSPRAMVFANGAVSTGGVTTIDGSSPFVVSVDPGTLVANQTTAIDSPVQYWPGSLNSVGQHGLASGTYNSLSTFIIQPRDIYGNLITLRTPRPEIQIIETYVQSGNGLGAIGGTFTLTYLGATTSPLQFNAGINIVQAALNSLTTIGDVVVSTNSAQTLVGAVSATYLSDTLSTPDLTASFSVNDWIRLGSTSGPVFTVMQISTTSIQLSSPYLGATSATTNVYKQTAIGLMYIVTFDSNLGDLQSITADGSQLTLTGGTGTATVKVTSCTARQIQVITTSALSTIGGSFYLRFHNARTKDLPYNIAASALTTALQQLPDIYAVNVVGPVAGPSNGASWTVTLLAIDGSLDILYAEGQLLTGQKVSITVADVCPSAVAGGVSSQYGILGDYFVPRLSGASVVTGYTSFASAGQYLATYKTPRAGTYQLDVWHAFPNGLIGSYYNNRWFMDDPAMTRVDAVVNFNWTGLITPTGKDYVSIRWEGYVQPAFSEQYTFVLNVNDGARLWIDHTLVLDKFEVTTATAVQYQATPIALVSGRLYDITIEYRENTDVATCVLMWQSLSQDLSIVPTERLFYPDASIVGSPFSVAPFGVHPSAPLNPSLSILGAQSLRLSFFPPLDDGGAIIDGYRVEWWEPLLYGTLDQQTIKIAKTVTGGSFTITFGSSTTGPLAYNILYSDMERAIEALTDAGDCTVTMTTTATTRNYLVVFRTALATVPTLTVDGSLLTGSTNIGTCQGGSTVVNASPSTIASGVITCAAGDSSLGTATVGGSSTSVAMAVAPGAPYTFDITGLTQSAMGIPPSSPGDGGSTGGYMVRVTAHSSSGFYGLPSVVVQLKPMAVPSAPTSVALNLVAGVSSALRVYWSAPNTVNGAAITNYKIEWDISSAFNTTLQQYVNTPSYFLGQVPASTKMKYTIQGLTPGVLYYVRVRAQNVMGFSDPLPNSLTETPRDQADAITVNGGVTLSTLEVDGFHTVLDATSSLLLSWLPSQNEQGSPVTKYLLEWYETASPGTQEVQYSQCTTDYLPVDVTAAAMTSALNSLPCLRSVQVVRSGLISGGYEWSITFLTEYQSGKVLSVGANDLASPNKAWDVGANMDPTHVGATSVNVNVNQNSAVVASVGIQSSAAVGMYLQIAGITFQIAAVTTDQVTLTTPYLGTTGTGVTAVLGKTVSGVPPPSLQSLEFTDTSVSPPFVYHVSNLSPGVSYTARVSCFNNRGYNIPTSSLSTAPPQQAPSRPLQVKVTTGSASTLSVYWSHPQSDGGISVAKYRVEWDVSPSFNSGNDGGSLGSTIVSVIVPGVDCVLTPCQATIGSLQKGTQYFVRVYAYNKFGYSADAGVPSPLATTPQSFPMPPNQVLISPGQNATLVVSFSTQHDNGGAPVTQYKIEWDCMDQHAVDATPGLTSTDLLYMQHATQSIVVSAAAFDLRGTFRLAFSGSVTPWLNYDTSATVLQQTLQNLDTIGAVSVTRSTVGNGFQWLVTFWTNRENSNHNGDIPSIVASILPTENYANFGTTKTTAAGATLLGTSAAIQITTTVYGYNGYEQQSVTLSTNGGGLQGQVSLTFDGQTTVPLPYNASALAVKSALESLRNTGVVWVTRFASGLGTTWNIMFLTRLGSLPLISVGRSSLYSSDPTANVYVNVLETPGRLPVMSSTLYGSNIINVNSTSQMSVQYTIPSLIVGAYYYVRVSAWNGFQNTFGSAQYSTPPVEAPQLPPGSPLSLVVEANSTQSLSVSWAPPLSDGGSPIIGYTIEWDTMPPPVYEVQQVIINATGTLSGYFTLSYSNYRTTNLQWNAQSDLVASALNALPSIGGVNVSRSSLGQFGYIWNISFVANAGNLPLMTVQSTNLVGLGVSAIVVEAVAGKDPPFNTLTKGSVLVSSQPEVQEVFVYAGAPDLGGTFNLVFSSESSVAIPFDASADVMTRALQGMSTVTLVSVSTFAIAQSSILCRQQYGRKWLITFSGSDGNVPLLLATTTAGAIPRKMACGGSLTGTTPCVSTKEISRGGVPLRYTITNLQTGTPYFVRIQARNRFASSQFQVHPFAIAPTLVAPLPVQYAYGSMVSNTQIGVVWTAPSDSSVANYKLQWDTTPSFSMTTTSSGSATVQVVANQTQYSYVIGGLSTTAYFVRLMTYNAGGFSDPSPVVPFYVNHRVVRIVVSNANINGILASLQTFTMAFANYPATPTVAVPVNARAAEIQAALQSLVFVGSVIVKRNDHSLGPALATLDTSGVDTNSFRVEWFVTFISASVDNITPDTLGALSVSVSTGTIAAADFNVVDVVPGTYPLPSSITPMLIAPDVPRNVAVTAVSSTTLGVQWTAPQYVSGITKYLIEWDLTYQFTSPIQTGTSFTNAHSSCAVVVGSSLSYLINGLTTGSSYYVRVSAYNGQVTASNMGYSSAVVATGSPIAPLPQAPYKPVNVGVTVSPLNIANQLDVFWNEPTVNALGFTQGNGGSPITSYTVDVSTQSQFATYQSFVVSTYDASGNVQSCAVSPCHFPLGVTVQTLVVAAPAGSFQLVHTTSYPDPPLCAACALSLDTTLNQLTYTGDLRTKLGTNVKFIVDKAGAACAFTVAAVATPQAGVVKVLPGYTCSLPTGTYSIHTQPTTSCLPVATLSSSVLDGALVGLANVDNVDVTKEPGPSSGSTLYRITFSGLLVTGSIPQLQVASPDGSGGCTALTGTVWTGTSIMGGVLTPGTSHYVRVSAGNVVGTGPPQIAAPTLCPGGCPSDNTIFPVARPPPPQSVLVYAKPSDRSKLRLTWATPLTTNGAAVSAYFIEYSVDNFATSDVCGGCVVSLASNNVLTLSAQVTTLQVGDMVQLQLPTPCIIIVSVAPTWNGVSGTMSIQPNHGCLSFSGQTIFMTDLHGTGSGYVQVLTSSLTSPYSIEITVAPNTGYTVQMRSANLIGIGLPATAVPTCDNTLVGCTASPGSNVVVSRQLPAAPTLVLPMQLVSGVGNMNGFTQTSIDVIVRDTSYWHGLEAIDSFVIDWDITPSFNSAAMSSVTIQVPGGALPTLASRYAMTSICTSCVSTLATNVLTVTTSTANLNVGRWYTINSGALNCAIKVTAITSATQASVQSGYTCLDFSQMSYSLSENDWLGTTITGLTMGTMHYIRATAHNSLGMGTIAAFQTVSPFVSSDPPTQVTLSTLDSSASASDQTSSLLVSWMPPNTVLSTDLNGNGGTPVTQYLVEWSTQDWSTYASLQFMPHVQTIATTSSGNVLSGSFQLQLDTTGCARCKVKSLSVSSAIPMDASPARLTQILQNMPNIGQVTISTTGLTAKNEQSWSVTFVSEIGVVPAFTVATNALTALNGLATIAITQTNGVWSGNAYCNANVCNTVAITPSTTYPIQSRITGLAPGTTYFVRVSAFTSLGYGLLRLTAPISEMVPYDVPAQPTSLYNVAAAPVLYVTCPTSLLVAFKPATFTGGAAIISCTVEWDTSSSFNSGVAGAPIGATTLLGNNANGAEVAIKSLTSGQVYFTRVFCSNNQLGAGPPIATVPSSEIPRQKPAVVSAVALAAGTDTTGSSMVVSWNTPNSPGSSISGYMVEWFTKAPSVPYFGVQAQQLLSSTGVISGGTFTVAFGPVTALTLPGVINAVRGQNYITTSVDLTSYLYPGDLISISGLTYMVSPTGTFTGSTIPLANAATAWANLDPTTLAQVASAAYTGNTIQGAKIYTQYRTTRLSINVLPTDLQVALENLPSIGRVRVARTGSTNNYVWTVTFVSQLGPLSSPNVLRVNSLGLTGTSPNLISSVAVVGTSPLNYRSQQVASTANSVIITGLTAGTPYYVYVKASNDRGFGMYGTPTPPSYVPIGVPSQLSNVYLRSLSPTQVELSYDEVDVSGGASVDQYIIQYGNDASFQSAVVIPPVMPQNKYFRVTTAADLGPIDPTSFFTLSLSNYFGVYNVDIGGYFTLLTNSQFITQVPSNPSGGITQVDLTKLVGRGEFIKIGTQEFRVCLDPTVSYAIPGITVTQFNTAANLITVSPALSNDPVLVIGTSIRVRDCSMVITGLPTTTTISVSHQCFANFGPGATDALNVHWGPSAIPLCAKSNPWSTATYTGVSLVKVPVFKLDTALGSFTNLDTTVVSGNVLTSQWNDVARTIHSIPSSIGCEDYFRIGDPFNGQIARVFTPCSGGTCSCAGLTASLLPLGDPTSPFLASSLSYDALQYATQEIQTIRIATSANDFTPGVGGFRLQFGTDVTATTLAGGDGSANINSQYGCLLWASGTSPQADIADSAAIQAELMTLPSIDQVSVSRKLYLNPTVVVYSVTFTGYKVRGLLPTLQVIHQGTNGCSAFAGATPNVPVVSKIQSSYVNIYRLEKTNDIPVTASALDVKAAIESLSLSCKVDVYRTTAKNGYNWFVTFSRSTQPNLLSFQPNDFKLSAILDPSAAVTRMNKVVLNVPSSGQSVYARVAAHNIGGLGQMTIPSPSSTQATSRPPSRVTSLRVDVVSDTELLVQWQDPIESGGQNVSEFNVEWSTGATKWNQVVKYTDTVGVNDVEVISVSAPSVGAYTFLGGSFQLQFDNQVTDELPFDISAANMQAALQSLCTIDSVAVTRELGPNGFTWLVTFSQKMYAGNQFTQYTSKLQTQIGHRLAVLGNNLLICSDISRTQCQQKTINGAQSISPSAVTGSLAEIQTLLCTAAAGQTFVLNYMGYATTAISTTATQAQFASALASLPFVFLTATFSAGQTSVCDPTTPLPVAIQFSSEMGDVPLLTATGTGTFSIVESTKGRFQHRVGVAPHSYLITGLLSANSYTIRVAAYNNLGYGSFHQAMTTYIPKPKGPTMPATVRLLPQTATSFAVVWEEPMSYGGSAVTNYIVDWDHTRTFRSQCGDNAEVQYLTVAGLSTLDATKQFQLSIGTTVVGCINWGITDAALQTLIRAITGFGAVTVVRHGDASAAWNYGHMYEVTFYSPLTSPPLGNVPTMVAALVPGCASFTTGIFTVTTQTFGPGLDTIEGVGRQTPTDNECNAMYLQPLGRKTVSDSVAKATALSLAVPAGTNLKPLCLSCAQTLSGTTVTVTTDLSTDLTFGQVFSIGSASCVYTVQASDATSITIAPGQTCPGFTGQALPVYRYSMRAYVVQDAEAGKPYFVRVAAQNSIANGPPNYSY
ncbi:hypothetical protein LEN26_006954, partial [Aphanomyces euteiches]